MKPIIVMMMMYAALAASIKPLDQEKVVELKDATIEKVTYESGVNKLYYYVDMADYKEFEENVLTVQIETREDMTFNAKYVSGIPKEELIENMPVDKTQYDYFPTQYPNYYHMFINKLDNVETQSYLLIYIELKNEGSDSREMSIVLGERQQIFTMTDPTFYMNIKVKDYVPLTVKILLPKKDTLGESFIVYNHNENYQWVFEGDLFLFEDIINKRRAAHMLYAYTLPPAAQDGDFFPITLVYFGPRDLMETHVQNTFSKITYVNGHKPMDITFDLHIPDSTYPLYFIGTYTDDMDYLTYLEEFEGKLEMYEKTKLIDNTIDDLLTKNLTKLDEHWSISATYFDLYVFKCISAPCNINLHFMTNYLPLDKNQSFVSLIE